MKQLLQKTLILLFIGFLQPVKSQSDSIDLRSRVLRQLNYDNSYKANYSKLSFHAYFDIIKQAGAGINYAPWPFLDLDARVYGIYPFSPGSKFIFYDDYFNYNGIGTSLLVKFFPNSSNNGFYFGPYGSLHYMEYRNRWIPYHSDDHDIYKWQKQSKFIFGKVPFTSMAIGCKKNYKHIGIDFFFGMGACFSNIKLVVQERKVAHSSYPGFKDPYGPVPLTKQYNISIPDAVLGIKLSLGTNRKQIKKRKYFTNYFETCIYSVCEKPKIKPAPLWVWNPLGRIIWNAKNEKETKPYKKALRKEYRKHSTDEQYLIEYTNDMIDDYIKNHSKK